MNLPRTLLVSLLAGLAGLSLACTPPPPSGVIKAPRPIVFTDPRFDYCYEAVEAGYGPYYRGVDPEYDWYVDADSDNMVCDAAA